jgi:hypothetical protein
MERGKWDTSLIYAKQNCQKAQLIKKFEKQQRVELSSQTDTK